MLFDFWATLPPQACVHPKDRPILDQYPGIFELDIPPGHVNGPLKTAPVVACYLNPGFEEEDRAWFNRERERAKLFRQVHGEDRFPLWFPRWRKWYLERVWDRKRIGEEQLAQTVAIFNVCAYASPDAQQLQPEIIQRLPSSQMARCYLREVLIPQARRGERFLVIARGHREWGVDRSLECRTIRFSPNPRGGHFGKKIRDAVYDWLDARQNTET